MAKTLYGAGIPDLHGRLQGYSFQNSQYGPQINTVKWGTIRRTIPTNKTRAAFLYISSHWRTLSQNDRTAWEQYGAPQLSGFNQFMKTNLKIVIAGGLMVTYPPISPGTPTFTFQSMHFTFIANGEIDQLIVKVKSSKPYTHAELNVRTWLAPAKHRYDHPQHINRILENPNFMFVNGKNIELRYNWSIVKAMIQTIPGWEQDIWIQFLDRPTNNPIGGEIKAIRFMNARNTIISSPLSLTFDTGTKKYHVKGDIKFSPDITNSFIKIHFITGTSSGVVPQWPGAAMSPQNHIDLHRSNGVYHVDHHVPYNTVPSPGFAYIMITVSILNANFPIALPIYDHSFNPL